MGPDCKQGQLMGAAVAAAELLQTGHVLLGFCGGCRATAAVGMHQQ